VSLKRSEKVEIQVDGTRVLAEEGQTVAGALVAAGLWNFGYSFARRNPRGPFCGMGVCFECELTVDGEENVRACLRRVKQSMVIQIQGATLDTNV